MPLGVVLERRDIDNPWQSVSWRAVAVIPGAPEIDQPRRLRGGPGWEQYHAATVTVELHRSETEGYKHNVSNEEVPKVYVVLRFDEEDEDGAPRPALATVCPYEASAYLDTTATGEMVEPVPMPDGVRAWVQEFVAKHHVDAPFVKKRKKKWFAQLERAHVGRAHERAHETPPARRGEGRHE